MIYCHYSTSIHVHVCYKIFSSFFVNLVIVCLYLQMSCKFGAHFDQGQLVISTAEPQRQFEIAFRMMDCDGNNYIDKSEFLQVLSSYSAYCYIYYATPTLLFKAQIPYSTKWWRGKTLANLANPEQFAQVLLIQIYIIKLRVDSMTNEYRANSKHAWKL